MSRAMLSMMALREMERNPVLVRAGARLVGIGKAIHDPLAIRIRLQPPHRPEPRARQRPIVEVPSVLGRNDDADAKTAGKREASVPAQADRPDAIASRRAPRTSQEVVLQGSPAQEGAAKDEITSRQFAPALAPRRGEARAALHGPTHWLFVHTRTPSCTTQNEGLRN
jgi:hypothetical protein